MATSTDQYKQIAAAINNIVGSYNYHVAPKLPAGGRPRAGGYAREFRLQLKNPLNDTSDSLIKSVVALFKNIKGDIKEVKYNQISPNSSKFPSVEFKINGEKIDVVIARGSNKGENFEKVTTNNLAKAFGKTSNKDPEIIKLVALLNDSNKDFAKVDITDVRQRTGATKKEGVPIANLGAVIGDIVLTDTVGRKWFVSLKNIDGLTFSAYSGAASLFNKQGDLQPESAGAKFLEAFGADLNQIQSGFDGRNNITAVRKKIPIKAPNAQELKSIFERAWGMNYFYVKQESAGWKVFWIDRKKLDTLVNNIQVTTIRYPNAKAKQITIECQAGTNKYLVEMRNSKRGEYPNDIKMKVRK